jgi:hypothetical protein
MYEFFSFRFLTTEAMLPLLPCTARHWLCLISSVCAIHPTAIVPLDAITLTLLGDNYKLLKFRIMLSSSVLCHLIPLRPEYHHRSTLFHTSFISYYILPYIFHFLKHQVALYIEHNLSIFWVSYRIQEYKTGSSELNSQNLLSHCINF